MPFDSQEYKKTKEVFVLSLKPQFSSSEIQLIWRESLIHFFGISASQQMTDTDTLFSESEIIQLQAIVNRLIKGEPFQYIVGEVEFYGLNIQIDPRALIPRPETEELTDWIVKDYKGELRHLLDVCSGSGCISLALSSVFQKAQISGLDYSEEAVELSEENALALKLPVRYHHQDVTDAVSLNTLLASKVKSNGLFDVVVSNPPYIPEKEKKQMDSNVLDYEPELALFVPNHDPLLFYRSIARAVYPYLSTNGSLYFECHYLYTEELRDILLQLGYQNVEKRRDLQGKWRMLKAQKS